MRLMSSRYAARDVEIHERVDRDHEGGRGIDEEPGTPGDSLYR